MGCPLELKSFTSQASLTIESESREPYSISKGRLEMRQLSEYLTIRLKENTFPDESLGEGESGLKTYSFPGINPSFWRS